MADKLYSNGLKEVLLGFMTRRWVELKFSNWRYFSLSMPTLPSMPPKQPRGAGGNAADGGAVAATLSYITSNICIKYRKILKKLC